MPTPTLGSLLDEAEWAAHLTFTQGADQSWSRNLVAAHAIATAGGDLVSSLDHLGSRVDPNPAALRKAVRGVTKRNAEVTQLTAELPPHPAQAVRALKAAAAIVEGEPSAWPRVPAFDDEVRHLSSRVSHLIEQAADHALWHLPVQVPAWQLPTAGAAARSWVALRQRAHEAATVHATGGAQLSQLRHISPHLDGDLLDVLAAARTLTHRALVVHTPGHQDLTAAMIAADSVNTVLHVDQENLTDTFWAALPRTVRTLTPSSSGYLHAMETLSARLDHTPTTLAPLERTAAAATAAAMLDDLRTAWAGILNRKDLVVSTRHVPSADTGLNVREYLDARRHHRWAPLAPEAANRATRVLVTRQTEAQITLADTTPRPTTPVRTLNDSAGITPTGITPT